MVPGDHRGGWISVDAVKHVQSGFFLEWLNHLRSQSNQGLFAVGEYWSYHLEVLMHFIETTNEQIMLFDASLYYNFSDASQQGKDYDLRKTFDGALVQERPELAVTLVSNHDTQPLQSLESVVVASQKVFCQSMNHRASCN